MSSIREKPRVTSRNVELVFRSLSNRGDRENDSASYKEYERLDEEYDALRDELLGDKRLAALEKAKDKAYQKYRQAEEEFCKKVKRVRNRYYVNGLTPEIVKELNQLLDEAEAM